MTKAISLHGDLIKANERLKEALAEEPTDLNKDATIQRFEFTFELAWKLMQEILKEERIDVYGVKSVFRESARLGLVEGPVVWFDFLESRNLTAHTYDQDEAREIYEKIKDFPPVVESLIEKSKEMIASDKNLS